MQRLVRRRDVLLGGGAIAALGGAAVYTKTIRSRPIIRSAGPEIPAFLPKRDLAGLGRPMTAKAKDSLSL